MTGARGRGDRRRRVFNGAFYETASRFMTSTLNTINRAIVQVAQTEAFKTTLAPTGLIVQASGTAAQDQGAWRAEYDRLAATLKRFDINLPEEKRPSRGTPAGRRPGPGPTMKGESDMAGRPIGELAR